VPKPSDLRSVNLTSTPAEEGSSTSASGKSVETVPKAGKRRTFTAADKLRIVKEAESCLAGGKRGDLEAMLRREGITPVGMAHAARRPWRSRSRLEEAGSQAEAKRG
jgi:hypothetical protein